MKCEICGSPRAHYIKSRKHHWKGAPSGEHGAPESRKDFRVKCSNCGAEYEDKPTEVVESEVQET